MAITVPQIRAARALLKWRQRDLAEKSAMAAVSIRKIESGAVTPRKNSLAKIEVAFAEAGVGFSGASGVRLNETESALSQ